MLGLDFMQIGQNNEAEKAQIELELVRKLIRLSKICWSPTLRANAGIIKSLGRKLQATSTSRRKTRQFRQGHLPSRRLIN
jgi:hypothetical protein